MSILMPDGPAAKAPRNVESPPSELSLADQEILNYIQRRSYGISEIYDNIFPVKSVLVSRDPTDSLSGATWLTIQPDRARASIDVVCCSECSGDTFAILNEFPETRAAYARLYPGRDIGLESRVSELNMRVRPCSKTHIWTGELLVEHPYHDYDGPAGLSGIEYDLGKIIKVHEGHALSMLDKGEKNANEATDFLKKSEPLYRVANKGIPNIEHVEQEKLEQVQREFLGTFSDSKVPWALSVERLTSRGLVRPYCYVDDQGKLTYLCMVLLGNPTSDYGLDLKVPSVFCDLAVDPAAFDPREGIRILYHQLLRVTLNEGTKPKILYSHQYGKKHGEFLESLGFKRMPKEAPSGTYVWQYKIKG